MLNRKQIEAVLEELSHQQGHLLNGQERLEIRNRVSMTLQARERHRQRMEGGDFEWKKPERPRR